MSELESNIERLVLLKMNTLAECVAIDAQVEALMIVRNKITEPFDLEIADLEKTIASDVISMGHSYEGTLGAVNYRKGYVRTTWNNDKLEGYGTIHPEILDFKKVTPVSPNAFIKLNE